MCPMLSSGILYESAGMVMVLFLLAKGRLRASYVCGSKAFIQKLVDEVIQSGYS